MPQLTPDERSAQAIEVGMRLFRYLTQEVTIRGMSEADVWTTLNNVFAGLVACDFINDSTLERGFKIMIQETRRIVANFNEDTNQGRKPH